MQDFVIKHEASILKKAPFFAIFFLVIGASCLGYGLFDRAEHKLTYDESSSNVNYKVYLLKNNTYPESYIIGANNRSYPTSLIDYLDLNFSYNVQFASRVEGDLRYRLVAVSSADKADGATNSSLWSEEHNLTQPATMHISGDNAHITINQKIIYDTYATILRNFEAEARGVAAKGSLNVALVIDGDLKPVGFVDATNFSSRLDFTIPIVSNSSVEAKTKVRNSQVAELSEIPARPDILHFWLALIGGAIAALGFLQAIMFMMARHHKIVAHPYEENIRKLLSAYDGIIVAVKHAPAFNSNQVSDVEDFDELLDAYNSVHEPINFYQSRHASYFVIIGEKNIWRYIVSESDFVRHGQSR